MRWSLYILNRQHVFLFSHTSALSRSGKSSIQRVVFGKMPPNDTLYLESTTKIQKEDVTYVSMTLFMTDDLTYKNVLLLLLPLVDPSLIFRYGISLVKSTFSTWHTTRRRYLVQ